jgi:phage terminase large subunit-like protein
MAIDTIRTRDKDKQIKFTDVKAGANKATRAQPIVALYEQGVIHHAGNFGGLENQMCTWSPLESKGSPDRIDALVWALSRLKIKRNLTVPGIRAL